MVSRIEVIPSEVRGYGNIVGAKSLEDFVPVGSELVYSENVYSLTALEGLRITLTASSSSISYGSSVSLSATVVDNDEPVTGVSVSFYDGSTSLGTATTNSNGVATYTTSSLTVGSHSLSATYDDKTSNSVSVIVNKLSSTISLTVPASGTVGTAYTVTGTLVPSTGSVKLYENGSLKDTLTVSSGSFSKAITQSNEGTYSYYVVFEGSSTYDSATSSIQSITVEAIPVPSFDGITLTGNKNILSAADSEYVTLEAQLTDSGSAAAVSGETVTFTVYKSSDDSVVTTLTDDTDSTGLATVSYYGNGTGDIYIKSSANSILSDPYSIEDCYLYDDASTDKLSNYTKTSSLTATHDTDHYVFSTSSNNQFVAFSSGHDNVRFEVKVMPKTNLTQNSGVSIGSTSGTFNSCVTCYTRTSNTIAFNKHSGTTYGGIENYSYTWSLDTYYTFFVEVNGSSVKIGVLDSTGTLIRQNTVSMSITNKYLKFVQTNGTVTSWIKDIKVKAL